MSDLILRKRAFIGASSGIITDHYTFGERLGDGSFGVVLKATHKVTAQHRAVKIIPKNKIHNHARLETEINLMKNTDHPHIVKLHDLFEDLVNIYLVMEECNGGELFDFIVRRQHLSEHEAREIMTQLLHALNYLHSHDICHRDIKPENLLFTHSDSLSSLKLIDFGLSKLMKSRNDLMTSRVGTPFYISPEVLTGVYSVQCDVWSAGVIMYVLLCGYPPFNGRTDATILAKVKRGVFNYDGEEWVNVSQQAKDMINQMLVVRPDRRLTAEQALAHAWMTMGQSDIPLSLNVDSLLQFTHTCKLQKSVLLCIASQCNEDEIENLKLTFEQLDTNGDGMLTLSELHQGLMSLSLPQLQEVWDSADVDKSGFVDYSEFLAATLERSLYMQEDKLWAAFLTFDKDGSGKISATELREVLGREGLSQSSPDFWENLLHEADGNGDGEIDFKEFIELMGSQKFAQILSRHCSTSKE